MKEPKKIELPREVWLGPKVISKVAHVCKKLELGKRALIVADLRTFELVGAKVKSQLERANFNVTPTIIKEADLATVAKVREISRGEIDFFLG
ncbi:MAG: hypothetical protein QW786_02305, partial [Candidatus Hadarchaeum sp.]